MIKGDPSHLNWLEWKYTRANDVCPVRCGILEVLADEYLRLMQYPREILWSEINDKYQKYREWLAEIEREHPREEKDNGIGNSNEETG